MSGPQFLKWFNARNLLLLLLTIVVSFFMMVLLIPPPKKAYPHSTAYAAVNALHAQLIKVDTELHEQLAVELRNEQYNAWLANNLNDTSDVAKQLGESPAPAADPWGNPYVFTRKSDEISNSRTGVYSRGRNGTSRSVGNDTDDLNSWNENSGAMYAQEVFAAGMEQILWPTLIMIGPLFVVLRRLFRYLGLMKRPNENPHP